jgi:hypothetical protein
VAEGGGLLNRVAAGAVPVHDGTSDLVGNFLFELPIDSCTYPFVASGWVASRWQASHLGSARCVVDRYLGPRGRRNDGCRRGADQTEDKGVKYQQPSHHNPPASK